MSKHEGMKVEIYTDIDITGRLEDGRGFPLDQAVMVEGCLRHRGDVVVPISAAHTICIICIFIFLLIFLFVFLFFCLFVFLYLVIVVIW